LIFHCCPRGVVHGPRRKMTVVGVPWMHLRWHLETARCSGVWVGCVEWVEFAACGFSLQIYRVVTPESGSVQAFSKQVTAAGHDERETTGSHL